MIFLGAAKLHNAFLSEGLRYEYPEIDIATTKSGGTVAQLMTRNDIKEIPLTADPDSYAQALLGGLRTGVNNGHWKHKSFSVISNVMPYLLSIKSTRLSLPRFIKREQ
jgi:hypothetical protein